MPKPIPLTVLVLITLAGCASQRALREPSTDAAAIQSPAARSAYYRAAAKVMSQEGYHLLNASEPYGFGVFREPLRAGPADACEDVRIDATFSAVGDAAQLQFTPCLVDRKAVAFAEAGLEICIPQPTWTDAACIDAAVARLKRAWRSEAAAILTPKVAAGCPDAVQTPAAVPQPSVVRARY
jgi:hypothetical protein